MFKYAARIEGLYDLLVQGIPQIKKHLELSSSLGMFCCYKICAFNVAYELGLNFLCF